MKKALLIGINYVSMQTVTLNGCIDDIVNVNNMIIDAYGYDKLNIVMLRDDNNNASTQPTHENIINELNKLAKDSANLEEIWIHYSGHGSQIQNTMRGSAKKMKEIIIPIDYDTKGYITDFEITNIIKQMQCRAILIFDSCHSGTICDLPWSIEYVKDSSYNIIKNEDDAFANPNVFLMSGCKDTQTSADSFNDISQEYVGAFSDLFIECLRDSHHNIEIQDLYRNVCISMKNNGFVQVPLLSVTDISSVYYFNRNNTNYVVKTIQPLIRRNTRMRMIF